MPMQEIGALLTQALQFIHAGHWAEAAARCSMMIESNAGLADAWNLLALARRGEGKLEAARDAARRATELRPKVPPYWLTLAAIQVERGCHNGAERSYRRAIGLAPSLAEPYFGLGRVLWRQRRRDEAVAAYRHAAQRAPHVAAVRYDLARALLAAGRGAEAVDEFEHAFRLDPRGELDRSACFTAFNTLRFSALSDFLHTEFARFIARDDIDLSEFAAAGAHVLLAHPSFRAVNESLARGVVPPAPALAALAGEPVLNRLLHGTVLGHSAIEPVLAQLRATFLHDEAMRDTTPVEFLANLAMQCFINEHVFSEDAREAAAARELRGRIEAGELEGDALARAVAVLAMYRPVAGLDAGPSWYVASTDPAYLRLVRRALSDVLEEQRIRAAMPVLTPIAAPGSAEVRAMYEDNPYPRWISMARGAPQPGRAWLASQLIGEHAPDVPDAPSILVAGCGTGREALAMAANIAGARVTAVDLSLASLAYAKRMAGELGVANVEFAQGDLLELGSLAGRFDMICCVGVLHHLREPDAGMRVLRSLGRPGAFYKIGLYSAAARAAVAEAHALVRERGWTGTPDSIRAFRAHVLALPPQASLRALLAYRDFFFTSGCRDLVFHVQDHDFTLPRIGKLLGDHRLALTGFSWGPPEASIEAYRAVRPGDSHMADLAGWQEVEARFPATFAGMYQFWCQPPAGTAAE